MPRKIPAKDVNRFWALRRAGHSIKSASTRCGFSESFGKGLVRHGRGDNSSPGSRPNRFREEPGPTPYDELSDIAKDCLEDFGRFRARYLGSISVPWQEECANRVRGMYESETDEYVVLNIAQGAGKTRFASHDLPAWLTARDRALRGILGSLGLAVSTSLTANLRDTLTRQVPVQPRQLMLDRGLARAAEATLAADYGVFKPTAEETNLWRRDQFTVAQPGGIATADKEPTWAAFSYEAKFLGWRVDLMVWDDLVNTRMLRNPEQVEALYRWWDDEAESRLDPGGLCLLVGQRLRSNDIYRYCLDKAAITDEIDDPGEGDDRTPRQYHHIVYKAHYDDLCDGEHSRQAPPYLEGGCLLDPKRITWQKIRAKQNAGNYEVVYQQEDSDPAQVLVHPIWVNGGTHAGTTFDGCWDLDRALGQLPQYIPSGAFTVRYMTVDPSPTKWWGIIDWLYVLPNDGTEPLAGLRYLVNMHRAKMGANEFLDWSRSQQSYLGLAEEWVKAASGSGHPITHLIMEKNAAQRWAMQYEFFRDWARTRGVNVIQHETTSNKADPEFGLWATLPNVYRHGRVRLPGDTATRARLAVYPLVQEITTYPHGSTDDLTHSQWFGEYNLQHLVHLRRPIGTIYTDMPTWAHKLEVAGAIG